MDNKEKKFAEALEAARKIAKNQDNLISTVQVKEIFADFPLNENQYELIYDYFKRYKIGIDEAVDIDNYLTNEEKEYLKEYLELLSKEHTIPYFLKEITDIAKQYVGQGVLLEDLVGEGNVALATYLTISGGESLSNDETLLRQGIIKAMEDLISETARNRDIDAQLVERVNAIADDARELADSFGRKVTILELAYEGKYSVDEIIEAISMAGHDFTRDIEH